MKKLFFLLLSLGIFFSASAQKDSIKYATVINFRSFCCGTPDPEPVLQYVSIFKKKYNLKKIAYDRYGPLGKEGEYAMAFHLNELNKRQKALFIKNLKLIVPTMKDKGGATLDLNHMLIRSSMFSLAKKEKILL